eukprot:c29016_g1_i4 orf=425-2776(+)
MAEDSSPKNYYTVRQPKLHKGMCERLSRVVNATLQIFPALEAVRPGCRAGIQALSALCLTLEKAKSLLHYCANCSKLYLVMTADSIVLKFEKVKLCLDHNLRQLSRVVSQNLAEQIASVLIEVDHAEFCLDPLDKNLEAEVLSLLLKEKGAELSEKEAFEQIAIRLGFISPKEVLEEQKALKHLLEKAQSQGDQKKESILVYFLHLLKLYSKSIKSNSSNALHLGNRRILSSNSLDRNDERHVACVRDLRGAEGSSHLEVSNCGQSMNGMSSLAPIPDEFRCPISNHLMSDPVIITSGHTYERICIEGWFQAGNTTCPQTGQKLENLSVTPNNCVKNLIALWCHKNGVLVPDPPSAPDCSVLSWNSDSFSSLDAWNKSEHGSFHDEKSLCTGNDEITYVEREEKYSIPSKMANDHVDCSVLKDNERLVSLKERIELGNCGENLWLESLHKLLKQLRMSDWEMRCRAAEDLLLFTTEKPTAVLHYADDLISIMVDFLCVALRLGCSEAQEIGVLILLKFCAYNRNNTVTVLAAGTLPYLLVLLKISCKLNVRTATVSILMMLSCLEEKKSTIGSSGVIPALVELLNTEPYSYVLDALIALCNLSTEASNQLCIIRADAVTKLVNLLQDGSDNISEKCLLLLYNISLLEEGRYAILGVHGCLPCIVGFLEVGNNREQEQAASILLSLCIHSYMISQLILKEGVIPSLIAISLDGTAKGREQAKRLLQFYKEQRQNEDARSPSLPDLHTGIGNTGRDGMAECFVGKICHNLSSLVKQENSLTLTQH